MNQQLQMDGNPNDLITASEVAEIWNRRAAAEGHTQKYTRRSVNVRRGYERKTERAHILEPAQKTPLGYLYRRADAWSFPISPGTGRKVDEFPDDPKSSSKKD